MEQITDADQLEQRLDNWQRMDKQLIALASNELKDGEDKSSILERKVRFIVTVLGCVIDGPGEKEKYLPGVDVVNKAIDLVTNDGSVSEKINTLYPPEGGVNTTDYCQKALKGFKDRHVVEIRRLCLASEIEEARGNSEVALKIRLFALAYRYGNADDVSKLAKKSFPLIF